MGGFKHHDNAIPDLDEKWTFFRSRKETGSTTLPSSNEDQVDAGTEEDSEKVGASSVGGVLPASLGNRQEVSSSPEPAAAAGKEDAKKEKEKEGRSTAAGSGEEVAQPKPDLPWLSTSKDGEGLSDDSGFFFNDIEWETLGGDVDDKED